MRHIYRQSKIFALSCALTSACGGTAKTEEADVQVVDTQTNEGTAASDAADASDAAASGDPAAQKAILAVKAGDTWTLTGLTAAVQVLRTEGSIPHIYAQNRKDLAHVMGFIMARDRYFQMELTRRVGLGTISNLLGDAALAKDIEARATGSAFVADNILSRLTQDQKDVFDGFADGINDYIAMVAAKNCPSRAKLALPVRCWVGPPPRCSSRGIAAVWPGHPPLSSTIWVTKPTILGALRRSPVWLSIIRAKLWPICAPMGPYPTSKTTLRLSNQLVRPPDSA